MTQCGVFDVWAADEIQPQGTNLYQTITGEGPEADRSQWDALYRTQKYVFGTEPAPFLRENVRLLPKGRVLDLATGEGRNAVYLAALGYNVDAVDLSPEALRKAKRLARSRHVTIHTIQADLSQYTIKPETYDVILNIQFLQKNLIGPIKKGLRKGGVLVFENYLESQLAYQPSLRRDYLLKKGELREWFSRDSDFEILLYRETDENKQALASLIVRRSMGSRTPK